MMLKSSLTLVSTRNFIHDYILSFSKGGGYMEANNTQPQNHSTIISGENLVGIVKNSDNICAVSLPQESSPDPLDD